MVVVDSHAVIAEYPLLPSPISLRCTRVKMIWAGEGSRTVRQLAMLEVVSPVELSALLNHSEPLV